jgi:PadR family transcriptional regulator AphA
MAAEEPDLSLTEWIVLALLVEQPAHGFALARELGRTTTLGQVWTVPRPLVYRALGRLEAQGLIVAKGEEPGDPGPPRTVYKVTAKGRKAVAQWLDTPVNHLREVRSAFLAKVILMQRSGADPGSLAAAQREAFAPVFDGLQEQFDQEQGNVVAAWRYESSQAVARLLQRF